MKTVRRILPLFAVPALAWGRERVVESVVPALAYGPACSSTVELQNLSDRPVVVDVGPHRASGALGAMAGQREITIRLSPRERSSYKLETEQETESARVKVRERGPSPGLLSLRRTLFDAHRHAPYRRPEAHLHHRLRGADSALRRP